MNGTNPDARRNDHQYCVRNHVAPYHRQYICYPGIIGRGKKSLSKLLSVKYQSIARVEYSF